MLEEERAILRRRRQSRRLRTSMLFVVLTASRHLQQSALTVKSVWVKEKSRDFFRFVVSSWSEDDFKSNFRMSRSTFQYLCSKLAPRLQKKNLIREPISVELRVAVTLWRLGTNTEYRSIGHLFGVGLATVCIAVHEVCKAIVDVLLPQYIRFPTGNRVHDVVEGFSCKWGFPQCVGAIDGTHIPILAPKDNPLDYFNRKGYHSLLMQALVSHDYTFLDVYIGWPGSVHDARVLTNSQIFHETEAGRLFPNITKSINGKDIPLLVVGDPAYPLLPWLMKPYSDTGQLTDKQRRFNYRLSRARIVVECAFGRLKGRWRSLLKRNDMNIHFLPTYVAACCILHNICEIHNDSFNDEWMVHQQEINMSNSSATTASSNSATTSAACIRETLSDFFQ